jgi:hypothetical protein
MGGTDLVRLCVIPGERSKSERDDKAEEDKERRVLERDVEPSLCREEREAVVSPRRVEQEQLFPAVAATVAAKGLGS